MKVDLSRRYVIGDCNRVAAIAASSLVAQRPGFNILFAYGPGGSGKSHLLRTMESLHRAEHPAASRVFINAGEIIRWTGIVEDAAFLGADLALIDDVDLLVGHGSAQQKLLDVIDTVERLAKGQIAMTSSLPSRDLCLGMMPRLVSRLHDTVAADLERPDYNMRADIIRAELEQWDSVRMSSELILLLARNLPADGHIVVGAVKRLALQMEINGYHPTNDEALRSIGENFNISKRIAVATIQEHTAAHFHIPTREMQSQRRSREVARPRQVSMYLSKQLTPKSLPEIGRLHGNRDHTTVIHALKQVERLRVADSELDTSIRLLERELTH